MWAAFRSFIFRKWNSFFQSNRHKSSMNTRRLFPIDMIVYELFCLMLRHRTIFFRQLFKFTSTGIQMWSKNYFAFKCFLVLPEELRQLVSLFCCRLKVGAKAKRRAINNIHAIKRNGKMYETEVEDNGGNLGGKAEYSILPRFLKKNRKFDLALIRTQFTQCNSFHLFRWVSCSITAIWNCLGKVMRSNDILIWPKYERFPDLNVFVTSFHQFSKALFYYRELIPTMEYKQNINKTGELLLL